MTGEVVAAVLAPIAAGVGYFVIALLFAKYLGGDW